MLILFVELQYELWIESIGFQEHKNLKIGQKWPKPTGKTCSKVLSRFHFTGEIALNDEYLKPIFPDSKVLWMTLRQIFKIVIKFNMFDCIGACLHVNIGLRHLEVHSW